VLANDTPANLRRTKRMTGLYLDKGIAHPLPVIREIPNAKSQTPKRPEWVELAGINYPQPRRPVSLRLPLGRLIMACGPSGAGKSTLFRDIGTPR